MADCVSRKIEKLLGEGMSQDQAVAVAMEMCGKSEDLLRRLVGMALEADGLGGHVMDDGEVYEFVRSTMQGMGLEPVESEDVYAILNEMTGAKYRPLKQVTRALYGEPAYAFLSLANNPDLTAIQGQVKQQVGEGANYQTPDTFHITLVYAEKMDNASLGQIDLQPPQLTVRATEFGLFDDHGDGRALHLKIEPTDDLKAYQRSVYEAFAAQGVDVSEYSVPDDWNPHITICYLPDGAIFEPFGVDFEGAVTAAEIARDDYQVITRAEAPQEVSAGKSYVTDGGIPMPDGLRANEQAIFERTYKRVLDATGDALKAALKAFGAISAHRQGMAVKARKTEHGIVIAGWAISFGTPDFQDHDDTSFPNDTDFYLDYYKGAPLFMEHWYDPAYGAEVIGHRVNAQVHPSEGVWLEHLLHDNHPHYDDTLKGVENGEFAYSSDSLAHLIIQQFDWNTRQYRKWPMASCALTRHPAEPRLGPVVAQLPA